MSSMPFIPMVPPVVVEDEPDDVSEGNLLAFRLNVSF
jgi:hypothetical protein